MFAGLATHCNFGQGDNMTNCGTLSSPFRPWLSSSSLLSSHKNQSYPSEKVQLRSMLVAEIWDAPSSSLSFAKMLSVVAGFAVNESDGKENAQGREALLAKAKATFLDEDEDEVCVSSDKELKYAFLQVLALPMRRFSVY